MGYFSLSALWAASRTRWLPCRCLSHPSCCSVWPCVRCKTTARAEELPGGGERRDLAGNFSRSGGLKEFVTYHPLPFSVGAEQPAAILRREPIIRPYFSRLLVSEQCESYLNLILRLSARLLAGPRQPPLRQRYLSYRGGLRCRQQCHLVIYGKLRGNISEEFH